MKKALAVLVLIGAAAVVCGSFGSVETTILGLGVFGEIGLAMLLSVIVIAEKETK